MSSVENSMPPTAVELNPRQQPPWLTIAWFSILLIACYFPVLSQLVHKWYNDEDMGHGFFVPVIAAYIAWQNRDKLYESGLRINNWGLAIIVLAGLQLYISTLAAELVTQRTAFIEAVIV